jgi:uncharacterized protein YchJ
MTLEDGTDTCPETSVQNYHSTLHNIAEERRSHYHLKSLMRRSASRQCASVHQALRFVSGCPCPSCGAPLWQQRVAAKANYKHRTACLTSCLVNVGTSRMKESIYIYMHARTHARKTAILSSRVLSGPKTTTTSGCGIYDKSVLQRLPSLKEANSLTLQSSVA